MSVCLSVRVVEEEVLWDQKLHCFKVKGRGQRQSLGSNIWRAAVDIKGLALPSA